MKQKSAFSLMELIITIVIAGILAVVGISGYMQSLIHSRRKDAITSLQRTLLASVDTTLNTTFNTGCTTPPDLNTLYCPYNRICSIMDASSNNCLTESGFYWLNYNKNGFIVPNQVTNNLIPNETVVLRATALVGRSQNNDIADCKRIYITNMNNIHPKTCIR